jgi:hypothetical protein
LSLQRRVKYQKYIRNSFAQKGTREVSGSERSSYFAPPLSVAQKVMSDGLSGHNLRTTPRYRPPQPLSTEPTFNEETEEWEDVDDPKDPWSSLNT